MPRRRRNASDLIELATAATDWPQVVTRGGAIDRGESADAGSLSGAGRGRGGRPGRRPTRLVPASPCCRWTRRIPRRCISDWRGRWIWPGIRAPEGKFWKPLRIRRGNRGRFGCSGSSLLRTPERVGEMNWRWIIVGLAVAAAGLGVLAQRAMLGPGEIFVPEGTKTAREVGTRNDATPSWTNAPTFEHDVVTFARVWYDKHPDGSHWHGGVGPPTCRTATSTCRFGCNR